MRTHLHYLILALILFFPSQKLFAQGTWKQKANLNSYRTTSASFSIGNKGYIVTGYDTSGALNDFWEYDPSANSWTKKTNFPGSPRHAAIGFSIGNKGYLGIGKPKGTGGILFNDFWEYNPDSNKWTQKANYPGLGRVYAVGFNIGNKGYVGTGSDLVSVRKDFWEYNPDSNKWIQKADFQGIPRISAIGFGIGNKGYLGTGTNGSINYNDFWEYNLDSNKWTPKTNVPNKNRFSAVGFAINNLGYVGLGNGTFNDLWAYDITSNTWSVRTSFPGTLRLEAFSFTIGNKAYLGAGTDSNFTFLYNDFWEYDPNTNGIEKTDKQNEFSIYPNPASGNIFIQSSTTILNCEITDISGRNVYQGTPQQNKNLLEINICVPDGIYFIKIITQDGIGNRKVMVRN